MKRPIIDTETRLLMRIAPGCIDSRHALYLLLKLHFRRELYRIVQPHLSKAISEFVKDNPTFLKKIEK